MSKARHHSPALHAVESILFEALSAWVDSHSVHDVLDELEHFLVGQAVQRACEAGHTCGVGEVRVREGRADLGRAGTAAVARSRQRYVHVLKLGAIRVDSRASVYGSSPYQVRRVCRHIPPFMISVDCHIHSHHVKGTGRVHTHQLDQV